LKGRIALLATIILLLGAFLIPQIAEGAPSRAISGKQEINGGFPSSASFTTVEVHDHDGNGRDEIYLGGAGRSGPKTQGIRAYEYDPSTKTWSAYGSGLPGASSGEYFGALGLGDVNKDGNMDIVAPIPSKWYTTSTEAVYIYTSNSNGAFTRSHTFSPGESTNEAEVSDIDGDGSMDIAYSTYKGIEVHFGSGTATSWTESSPTSAGNEIDGIAIGDLNNDGLKDIVGTPYFNSNKVRMYIQGSSRSWTEVTFKNCNNEAFGIKIADINNDGNNDVVYCDRDNSIKVWCGNGGGSSGGTSFTWTDNSSGLPTSSSSYGDPQQIELGDVNDDGKPDLIVSANGRNYSRIFLNNQPNSWTELFSSQKLYLGSGADGYGANFGDWDGDGNLDAAGCSWGKGVKAWLISRTVTPPPPENNIPMPVAGSDIEVMLGEEVLLDGRNSTDPDDAPTGDTEGNVLTYEWNFTSVPASSSINDDHLSPNDTVSRPTFQPDVPGIYQVTLAVYDGEDWSNESDEDSMKVTVIKPNDLPVAVTGKDLSGYVGDTFILDGTGSYDIDGDLVAFQWTCTSHTVTLTDDTTSTPEFIPSEQGTFRFTMRVMDDNMTWSLNQDTINVTAVEVGENVLPVADIGSYPPVMRGDTITLDGTNSTDPDGTIISYEWTCTSHTVSFTGQNTSNPSFTASEAGTYEISLRVEDSNHTWSSPDTTSILSREPYFNDRPVADAGEDARAFVSDTVVLDGTGSSDPNGNITGYNWTCTSHGITLSESLTATPSFIPTDAGIYIFTLAVRDNEDAWSQEDEVRITVTEEPVYPVNISTGPFLYTDDTPFAESQARLTPEGGEPLLGVVISDGTSSFNEIMPGNYTLEVLFEGEVKIGPLDIKVSEDGTVTYPEGGIPKVQRDDTGPVDDDDDQPQDDDDDQPVDDDGNGEKDDSSPIPIILAVVLVFLIAAGVIAFMIVTRRKGEEDKEGEGSKNCPTCGSDMEFREDFERYYCDKCGKYS
jgi:ribosomal protein S27AE